MQKEHGNLTSTINLHKIMQVSSCISAVKKGRSPSFDPPCCSTTPRLGTDLLKVATTKKQPMIQGYVREDPHIIWHIIWYSTSILRVLNFRRSLSLS
jgi:hypothetical protein